MSGSACSLCGKLLLQVCVTLLLVSPGPVYCAVEVGANPVVGLTSQPEWRFDGMDCSIYSDRAKQLGVGLPQMKADREKTQKMLEAINQDSQDAYDAAKKAFGEKLWEKAKEKFMDKARAFAKGTKLLTKRVADMTAAGYSRIDQAQWLRLMNKAQRLEKNAEKINGYLEKLVNTQNSQAEFKLMLSDSEMDECKSFNEELLQLDREFVNSGCAESLGDAVAMLGGPLTGLLWDIGLLTVKNGLDVAGASYRDLRDRPFLQKTLEDMDQRIKGIEERIAWQRDTFNDCMNEQAKHKAFDLEIQKYSQAGKKEPFNTPAVKSAPEIDNTKPAPEPSILSGNTLPLLLLGGATIAAIPALAGAGGGGGSGGGGGKKCPSPGMMGCSGNGTSSLTFCCPAGHMYFWGGKCYTAQTWEALNYADFTVCWQE
ncbi:MAG: hypothetical protein WCN95_15475 [bacterium]